MTQLELLPLLGHVIAFTGTLSIPRSEAFNKTRRQGARVTNYVSKATTMLIIGRDAVAQGTQQPSGKYCKALELIEDGRPLRIIKGEEFLMSIDAVN